MLVKSIAECCKGSILQYFGPSLSYHLSYRSLFGLFLSGGLTQGLLQGWHRLEKYLNLEGFLEKSLKIISALKSTGKSLLSLEKSLNSTIFCRT